MSGKCLLFVAVVVFLGNARLDAGMFKKLLATIPKHAFCTRGQLTSEQLQALKKYHNMMGILSLAASATASKDSKRWYTDDELKTIEELVKNDRKKFITSESLFILSNEDPALGELLAKRIDDKKINETRELIKKMSDWITGDKKGTIL